MTDGHLQSGEAVRVLRDAGVPIVREHAGDGSEIRCRCLRHPDPHGHLYVNATTGAAFCHKCGLRTHIDALCGRAAPVVSDIRLDILGAAAAYYHRHLSEEARRYLVEQRRLCPEVLDRFLVGWADGGLRRHLLEVKGYAEDACVTAGVLQKDERGVRDFFYRRLTFPNLVGGRVVHLSGRRLHEADTPKWLHLPGEITHPYNADALRKPNCLWTEGILDVLSAACWDLPAAAGLGTSFKEGWMTHVPDGNRVLVCLDGDPAGEAGALNVARMLGQRARIATLPEGKDPNDLLREGHRDEFEACLAAAQDVLTFEIKRIPANLPRPELLDRLGGIVDELAGGDAARGEAYLHVIKGRFGLNREEVSAYRQLIGDRRREARCHSGQTEAGQAEGTLTALFEGLVDLVEQAGRPAFLIVDHGKLRVVDRVERDGILLLPPPADQIPWLLPRANEVLRWVETDSDGQLYDDLVAYHQGISELPAEAHYHLIAAWDLHTYVLEAVQYSPVICLYAVPERGKTRTGKGMAYVAYRPIHVESLRDPYIVRFAAHFGGTIFFDVMNLWPKALKSQTEDVLLSRFERGVRVPRVNWPERGPHRDTAYYPVFGPTVIGTNDPVHHILDTRAITICMPQARRRFEADVTPEAARPLRERLVAFRARHLGEPLPDLPKPATGRLGDILKPLVQIMRLVRPEREDVLRDLTRGLQSDRMAEKAQTLESDVLRIMDGVREDVDDNVLPVRAVTEKLNEDRPENAQMSPQRVGKCLRSLGFAPGKRTSAGTTIRWDEDKLVRAMEAYGLRETAQTAHSTPEEPGGAADSAECVECAESSQGVPASGAHAPPASSGPEGLTPAQREAFDERVAIMAEDGTPPQEAQRRALECVKREFGT